MVEGWAALHYCIGQKSIDLLSRVVIGILIIDSNHMPTSTFDICLSYLSFTQDLLSAFTFKSTGLESSMALNAEASRLSVQWLSRDWRWVEVQGR